MQCRESGERCPLHSCSLYQHQHPEGAWQLRLGYYKIYNIYCSYYSHTCRPHGWDRIVGNLNWCHVLCTNSFNRHIDCDIQTVKCKAILQQQIADFTIYIVYFASTHTVWVLLTLLTINVPHHVLLLRTYDGMSTCGWFVYSSVVLVKCVSTCFGRTTHKWAQMWRGVSPLLSCARQYHKHHVYSQCVDYAQIVSII